jgi:hypothetical protein
LKRKLATRISASALASTSVRRTVIAVKTRLCSSDRQKTESWTIALKLLRPTQSRLGSPAVTSVKLNAMARKNGMTTSPMM